MCAFRAIELWCFVAIRLDLNSKILSWDTTQDIDLQRKLPRVKALVRGKKSMSNARKLTKPVLKTFEVNLSSR